MVSHISLDFHITLHVSRWYRPFFCQSAEFITEEEEEQISPLVQRQQVHQEVFRAKFLFVVLN